MKWMLFLSLPLYLADQLSKRWVLHNIDPESPRIIIPGVFDIVHVTNTGAAFGSFKNNNAFFVVLSFLALASIIVLLLRGGRRDAWRDISLALLVAGVAGNLTDRLSYGRVIDFLLFDLHIPLSVFRPWPAFNVADSCICVAVVCFIVYSLRDSRSKARSYSASV
ncbi:MAG: signal peptidase II [Verrucomicrobia bacterium]|nr:signal peptidase II [Verrucomicrobiota bacterium]